MFTTVSQSQADGGPAATTSIDVGKTLTGLVLGVVVLVGSLILYLNDMETPAAAFFALGEAIAVGVLGLTVGESSGANQAISVLSGE